MPLLGLLGGVGQGISAGVQDLERMDEQNRQKQAFEWLKKDRENQEKLDAALASVPTTARSWGPGYEGAAKSNAPMVDDDGNVMPGVTNAPRKTSQILADQAAAVRALGGTKNMALGLQLQNAATTEGRRENVDTINQKYQGYVDRINKGDIAGVMGEFNANKFGGAEANDFVSFKGPDGNYHVYNRNQADKGPVMSFADTNAVRDALNHARMHEMSMADPENFAKLALESTKTNNERDFRQGYLGIQQNELNMKKPLIDAQVQNALAQAGLHRSQAKQITEGLKGFSQILGQGDDGTIYGLTKTGGISTVPGPVGSDGKAIALFPKVTGAKPRDEVQKAWLTIESELIKAGENPDAISQQQAQFYARRGFAPPDAESVLTAGVNPRTKQPLTKADVEAYNKKYPKSQVKLDELPWYQSEIARQKLIDSIPK